AVGVRAGPVPDARVRRHDRLRRHQEALLRGPQGHQPDADRAGRARPVELADRARPGAAGRAPVRRRHSPAAAERAGAGGPRGGTVRYVTDDDSDVRDFARRFRAFLEKVHRVLPDVAPSELNRRMAGHLGTDPATLPVVTEVLPPYEQANIQAAMDAYLARPEVTAELIGIAGGGREHQGFADLVVAARHGSYDIGAVDYS